MEPPATQLVIDLPDEAATVRLAEDVAVRLVPGDVIALSGGLGSGKTTFARALIRALSGDPDLEVPSPTFTLAQTYAVRGLTVTHFDLYRIGDPAEIDELGLSEAAESGAVLVEWPENAGNRLPAERLTIALAIHGSGRRATVSGDPAIAARVARGHAVRNLLSPAGWGAAKRQRLAGDASTRLYERLTLPAASAILMDWPLGGQLAENDPRRKYRARDVAAFVAVDEALAAAGLSVPAMIAADRDAGFLLMEDFGEESVVAADKPVPARYAAAVEALALLHGEPRPITLPLPGGGAHALKPLTGEALLAELTLFADWYVPHARSHALAETARAELLAIWRAFDGLLGETEQSWVLFDVQSANLFWLPAHEGIARVGFIDFQDMFLGPAAYDVASLAFDARVDIDAALADDLVARYLAARRAGGSTVATDSFQVAFAIAGALRTMKNMGAFARFAEAGKPQYLKHLERLRGYLARLLAEPVLSPLALWYERHLSS